MKLPGLLRFLPPFCATVGSFIVPQSASAAVGHPKAKSDATEVLAGALFLNSVDASSDLYRACNHADFKTLAWALYGLQSKISRPKSEYETDSEFDSRNRKMEDAINGQRRIIVCQPLDDNEDAPFTYDADRQVFKGSFAFEQNVWRDTKRLGKYVSHTRMGVRATITSSLDIEYNVDLGTSLRNATSDCIKADYLDAKYEVPVARADAPDLKANGYLVFLGRLIYPFFDSSDSPGSPTLDDPRDVYERDMTVHFTPDEMAVVGPGRVQWRCVLKPAA